MRKNLYRVLYTIILLFIFYGGVSQSARKYRILRYGLPNFEIQNAEKVVAYKWNIEFYSVAGCMVDQALKDRADQQNAKVYKNIEVVYGENWRTKFDNEVDNEFKLQSNLSKLLDEQIFIKHKQREVEKLDGYLSYEFYPISKTSAYNVKVNGYENGHSMKIKYYNYYKLIVNYKTKSIKIISSKRVKE